MKKTVVQNWPTKALTVVLFLGVSLINWKNILTSCHVDAEYQVAMAYRLFKGDLMFSEMWEAHQTSAFYLAFFEWFFLKITGSTSGIVIFANLVGTLSRMAVALFFYVTIRPFVERKAAFCILLLGMVLIPKDIVLPDFANQQIWFAMCLLCALIRFFLGGRRPKWLVVAGLMLCLEVLSYPSCAIVWFACVILLGIYSEAKKRDIGIFTGICAICGGIYLLYFMRGEPEKFLHYIYEIWSGDETHAVSIGTRLTLIGNDAKALFLDMPYFIVVFILALFATTIWRLAARRRGRPSTCRQASVVCFLFFLIIYAFAYMIHLPNETADTKYHFFALYFFVIGYACAQWKDLNSEEKVIFLSGQFIGAGGFLATLFLSDCGLFTSIPYMIPNLLVSVIAIGKAWGIAWTQSPSTVTGECFAEKNAKPAISTTICPSLVVLGCLLLFRAAIYVNGWMVTPTNFAEDSIFGVNWTAEVGPLKGIVSRDGTYVADVSVKEWSNFVKPGDKVLILSYPTFTATTYLYEDVEICIDSLISTPTYSDRLMRYFEENPEKYPDIVAVKFFGGTESIGENAVSEWLHNEFEADCVEDGTYWRFYIKNAK